MSIQAALFIVTAGIGQGDAKMPTADELLQKAIKQRQAITRASVTFRYVSEFQGVREGELKTWLDGERLRNDLFRKKAGDPVLTRFEAKCRNSEKDGFSVHILPGSKKTVLFMKIGERDEKTNIELIDPRMLGAVAAPSFGLHNHRLESDLGQVRIKPTVERGRWKNHDYFIVKYTGVNERKVQRQMAVWIVPSMDHSVTRMEFDFEPAAKSKAPPQKGLLESELKHYGKAGIWYPKSCTFVQHNNGELYIRDTVEVLEATLIDDIPADTFRMIGMGIPPGTIVTGSGVPTVGLYFWDGKEIVRKKK